MHRYRSLTTAQLIVKRRAYTEDLFECIRAEAPDAAEVIYTYLEDIEEILQARATKTEHQNYTGSAE